MTRFDWVDWLLDVWAAVGEKQKSAKGNAVLSEWEELVDIFAHTEYCISNGGDLANMQAVRPDYRSQATVFARKLKLESTEALFGKPEEEIVRDFEDAFVPVCAELKAFIGSLTDGGAVGNLSNNWTPN